MCDNVSWGESSVLLADVLDCDIVVSEFELQLLSHVWYSRKKYELPYPPPAMDLIVLLQFFH